MTSSSLTSSLLTSSSRSSSLTSQCTHTAVTQASIAVPSEQGWRPHHVDGYHRQGLSILMSLFLPSCNYPLFSDFFISARLCHFFGRSSLLSSYCHRHCCHHYRPRHHHCHHHHADGCICTRLRCSSARRKLDVPGTGSLTSCR